MPSSTRDGSEKRTGSSSGRKSSDGGRPSHSKLEEMSRAREVLHNVPEMSQERMAEIRDRIRRGYYKRSDVLERIAKRLSKHL